MIVHDNTPFGRRGTHAASASTSGRSSPSIASSSTSWVSASTPTSSARPASPSSRAPRRTTPRSSPTRSRTFAPPTSCSCAPSCARRPTISSSSATPPAHLRPQGLAVALRHQRPRPALPQAPHQLSKHAGDPQLGRRPPPRPRDRRPRRGRRQAQGRAFAAIRRRPRHRAVPRHRRRHPPHRRPGPRLAG